MEAGTVEAGTVEASREECLALLATAPSGRLVLTEGALPAVLPVNFLLDPAGIVIRTAEGSSASLAEGRRARLGGRRSRSGSAGSGGGRAVR